MKVSIAAPDQYGQAHIQSLEVIVDITIRLSEWFRAGRDDSPSSTARYRLGLRQWSGLLDNLIATLRDPQILKLLADLADTDPS